MDASSRLARAGLYLAGSYGNMSAPDIRRCLWRAGGVGGLRELTLPVGGVVSAQPGRDPTSLQNLADRRQAGRQGLARAPHMRMHSLEAKPANAVRWCARLAIVYYAVRYTLRVHIMYSVPAQPTCCAVCWCAPASHAMARGSWARTSVCLHTGLHIHEYVRQLSNASWTGLSRV